MFGSSPREDLEIKLLMGETGFFLLTCVTNYRSAHLLAYNQFISDPFPWKKTEPARVGGERQKQGSKS